MYGQRETLARRLLLGVVGKDVDTRATIVKASVERGGGEGGMSFRDERVS